MEESKRIADARRESVQRTAEQRDAEVAAAEAQRRLDSVDLSAVMTRIPAIRARLGELAELRSEVEKAPATAAVVAERVASPVARCPEGLW